MTSTGWEPGYGAQVRCRRTSPTGAVHSAAIANSERAMTFITLPASQPGAPHGRRDRRRPGRSPRPRRPTPAPGTPTGTRNWIVQPKLCTLITYTSSTDSGESDDQPDGLTRGADERCLDHDHPPHLPAGRADEAQHRQLAPPLDDERQQRRTDAKHGDDHRDDLQRVGDGERAVEDPQDFRAQAAIRVDERTVAFIEPGESRRGPDRDRRRRADTRRCRSAPARRNTATNGAAFITITPRSTA